MSIALADNWTEAAYSTEQVMVFLRKYGKTLEFRHIGIYREEGPDKSPHYTTEPFGVFFSKVGKTFDVHQLDLDYMKLLVNTCMALPSNTVNDAIRRNMAPVMNAAIKNYNLYLNNLPVPKSPSLQNIR